MISVSQSDQKLLPGLNLKLPRDMIVLPLMNDNYSI